MSLFSRLRSRRALASPGVVQFSCELLECRTLLDSGGYNICGEEGAEVNLNLYQSASIYWGDGACTNVSFENGDDANPAHVYADSGHYDGWVESYGDTTDLSANIVDIAPFATLASNFDDATNTLTASLADVWDVSDVDMDAGLHYSVAQNYGDLANTYATASDDPSLQITSDTVGDHGAWIRIFDKDDGFRDYNPILKIPDLAVAALSSSQINLTWQDTVTGEQGWRVQRSTDGQNFDIIKNLPAGSTQYTDTECTGRHTLLVSGAGGGRFGRPADRIFPEERCHHAA